MGRMHEMVTQREPRRTDPSGDPGAVPGAWQGQIDTAPDANDQVEVLISAYSDERPFGPCDYMPRAGETPAPGDPCAIVFAADEHGEGEPVIVWWRPA